MNSLYTCSWGKNVAHLYNEDWVASVFDIITEAKGKRGKEAAPGYARLMSLKDIKNLAGTMTPRYFATKVLKQLSQDHPEVDKWVVVDDMDLSEKFERGDFLWGFKNFVRTPRKNEGIKQCNVKERILKFLV